MQSGSVRWRQAQRGREWALERDEKRGQTTPSTADVRRGANAHSRGQRSLSPFFTINLKPAEAGSPPRVAAPHWECALRGVYDAAGELGFQNLDATVRPAKLHLIDGIGSTPFLHDTHGFETRLCEIRLLEPYLYETYSRGIVRCH